MKLFLCFLLMLPFSGCTNNSLSASPRGNSSADLKTLYILVLVPRQVQLVFDQQDALLHIDLAVDAINSYNGLLEGFQLETIVADSDCDDGTVGVENFVRSVYHSGKQVVGVVGLPCTTAAYDVLSLCSHEQIDLLGIHLSLSDHLSSIPNAFGIVTPYSSFSQVHFERLEIFSGKNFAIIFEAALNPFITKLKSRSNFTVVSMIEATNEHIPLIEVVDKGAVIVVLAAGNELTRKTLCLAYHNELFFPFFQFVLLGLFDGSIVDTISFAHEGKVYSCTPEQLGSSLQYAFFVSPYLKLTKNNTIVPFSNFSSNNVLTAASVDGVLAFAICLNRSQSILLEMNLSLADYHAGRSDITAVLRDCFYQLDFNGLSSRIKFDQHTHFVSRPVGLAQVVGIGFVLFGFFSNGSYTQLNTVNISGKSSVPALHLAVSSIFMLLTSIQLVAVVIFHALNVAYRKRKSVKASSTRLKHVVFVGCYFLIGAALLAISRKAYESVATAVNHPFLCNLELWWLNLGLFLIIITVLVRTWRIYYINLCAESLRKPGRIVSDASLLCAVGVLLGGVVLLLTIQTAVSPLTASVEHRGVTQQSYSFEVVCHASNTSTAFTVVEGVYLTCLAVSLSILALLTRRFPIRAHRPRGIILLSVTLLIATAGSEIFSYLIANVNITLTITMVRFQVYFLVCSALVFVPPLWPIFKSKEIFSENRSIVAQSRNRLTSRTTESTLYSL